ncbi:MAG TPA: glycosyltransferase family 1 protein [Patescibacteria group bacterium]|nr:glycosyltransferase family 1 protein [Patescibacteria group bacterium]
MNRNGRNVNPRLLIDGRALLEPAGGGVFEYARRVAEALKASGRFDATVWANAWKTGAAPGIDALTHVPNKLLHASMRFAGRPSLSEMAGQEPDALWMPNAHFAPAEPGVPLVLTVHDLSYEIYPEFFSPKQRLWHRAVDPRALARRAAAILAVSETTKRDIIERWGVPPERVTVTLEGAPRRTAAPVDDAGVRARLRLPERFILHVGALEPRKNHLGLLDAYHQLRPLSRFHGLGLVLAGPPGWNNAGILRAIRRSPYRNDIRLLGYVAESERAALYRLASVFAFPSFYEGFGLPPVEAMAAGLPVVASHAGAIGEVVGDAGVLTDPYRPSELSDALAAVLDSPSLAALYAERGRKRAAAFDWNECAKKTEDAIFRVLG